MPRLDWIGKDKVINHHLAVPYRVLKHAYGYRSDCDDKSITNSGNIIIHGDNLIALKSLLPRYEGSIKCVYIDPPYNTGKENWVYNDNVNDPKIKKWLGEVVGAEGEDLSRHDKWLCMMYPRMCLLRQLLSIDGVIFISIDDNEYHNLKSLCDEIFGRHNFITNFIWYTEGHTDNQDVITGVHEYILCYAKEIEHVSIRSIVDPNIPSDSKILRDFAENSITKNGFKNAPSIITLPKGFPCEISELHLKKSPHVEEFYNDVKDRFISREDTQKYKMVYPARLDDMDVVNGKLSHDCRVFSGWMNAGKLRQFIKDGCIPTLEPTGTTLRYYLSKNGVVYYNRSGRVSHYVQSVLSNMGTTEKQKYALEAMGIKFDYPKPVELISYLISMFSEKDDIVLDSFAGSGTTSEAVLSLNKKDGGQRKFIMIELGDYADDYTARRARCVMSGYSHKGKQYPGTGGAFDFFELGEPLFMDDGNLNESLPIADIREYLFYSETRHSLPPEAASSPYYLGTFNSTGYYFFYEKEKQTTLDYNSLSIIIKKADSYVIYADVCLLSDDYMLKNNIVFKKIPRDIKQL